MSEAVDDVIDCLVFRLTGGIFDQDINTVCRKIGNQVRCKFMVEFKQSLYLLKLHRSSLSF